MIADRSVPGACDTLVVGGGPVGLATAVALRRKGMDVILAERRNLPFDKACGEGILPAGVLSLRSLGVPITEEKHHPLGGISFHDGDRSLEASFPGVPGVGITRRRLHQALRIKAEKEGVRLLWGVAVRGLEPGGAILTCGRVAARYVVAADGNHSPLRRRLGLAGRVRHRRTGLRRHYRCAPWTGHVQVWFMPGCEMYVTPVAADLVSVALLTDRPGLGFQQHLERFPALARRLRRSPPAADECAAITLFQRARRVIRGPVALVGDAALSVDAITGEGTSLGFQQALAVAEAMAAGDLRRYQRAHARLARIPILMTRLLLAAHHHPLLRRGLMAGLRHQPQLLRSLLALHTRPGSPALGP